MPGVSLEAGNSCMLAPCDPAPCDPAHQLADSEPQGGPRPGEGGVSGSDEVAHGAIDAGKDQRP